MDSVTFRPTQAEYDRAFDLYRTGADAEVIADTLGWDETIVTRLFDEGWPANGDQPALIRLRSAIRERMTRLRAAELDVIQQFAETAGRIAPTRARTMASAANIENAIMTAWAKHATAAMREGKKIDETEAEFCQRLCMPKPVLDNLRALRGAQVADVEAQAVAIFAKSSSRGPEEGGSSLEDQIYGDLADLTPEEQAEYSRTGKKPGRQQSFAFAATPSESEPAHE